MNEEKPYVPTPEEIIKAEEMSKDTETEIAWRRAKKFQELGKKYEKMTPEEKENKKMNELDSFYKWGSEGDYRLWGNGKTIEESTRLEFGWGYDPKDEDHNYSYEIWDQEDEKDKDGDNIFGSTKRNKTELLEHWNSSKKQAQEERQ